MRITAALPLDYQAIIVTIFPSDCLITHEAIHKGHAYIFPSPVSPLLLSQQEHHDAVPSIPLCHLRPHSHCIPKPTSQHHHTPEHLLDVDSTYSFRPCNLSSIPFLLLNLQSFHLPHVSETNAPSIHTRHHRVSHNKVLDLSDSSNKDHLKVNNSKCLTYKPSLANSINSSRPPPARRRHVGVNRNLSEC